jgi:hypothetical protein
MIAEGLIQPAAQLFAKREVSGGASTAGQLTRASASR